MQILQFSCNDTQDEFKEDLYTSDPTNIRGRIFCEEHRSVIVLKDAECLQLFELLTGIYVLNESTYHSSCTNENQEGTANYCLSVLFFKKKKTMGLTGGPCFSSTAWVNVNCTSHEQGIFDDNEVEELLTSRFLHVSETRKKEPRIDELCDSGYTS